jgi:hypothetical protein
LSKPTLVLARIRSPPYTGNIEHHCVRRLAGQGRTSQ